MRRYKVLIADDERPNLETLKRDLSRWNSNWEIIVAETAKEACEKLEDGNVDAVVTDLIFKGNMEGIDIAARAKEIDPLVVVIIFTAYEEFLDRATAFKLGVFDCVSKDMLSGAADEVNVKTRAGLNYRDLATHLAFMRRYFDPRVFELVISDPKLLALRSATASVCFWDVRGFSRACESLKARPDLIAAFLKEYFTVAANVINANHGVLDKYIGDGVMGIFGTIGIVEDSELDNSTYAKRAVNAACELRERFKAVRDKWLAEWVLHVPDQIEIGLGCGVHTGNVLIGNVGTELRDQYTALGPHVNFAARLESRAASDQILISAPTRARLANEFLLEELETINDVKNIPGNFRVFAVNDRA